MFRLNHKIQQHSTRVYAPLASRNVAEQIGSLYMRDVDKRREDAESGIGKEVDLRALRPFLLFLLQRALLFLQRHS